MDDIHVNKDDAPIKEPDPNVMISDAGLRGVTQADKLRGEIYRPEYSRGNDGFGELMTNGRLSCAAHWEASFDEAYQAQNLRRAKVKSSDIRRQQMLIAEIPETIPELGGYRNSCRAYVNSRRRNRREGKHSK